MRHHRTKCYGMFGSPVGWHNRYANAYGWNQFADQEEETSCYEQREHSSRQASRQGKWGGSRRGGRFGARRPLRYLSYQLDLDDSQRRRIAAVLERMKVDREQVALDEKKTIAELASLVRRDDLSVDALRSALAPRVRSSETLQAETARALQDIVETLDADQREEFSYLLSSGAFRI